MNFYFQTVAFFALLSLAFADFVYVPADSVSRLGVSPSCAAALTKTITCSEQALLINPAPTSAELDSTCSSSCLNSIRSFIDDVKANCANEGRLSGTSLSASNIENYLLRNYESTCLSFDNKNCMSTTYREISDFLSSKNMKEIGLYSLPGNMLCSECSKRLTSIAFRYPLNRDNVDQLTQTINHERSLASNVDLTCKRLDELNKKNQFPIPAIVGGTVGGAVAIAGVIAGVVIYKKKQKK
ncbi:hypothetical protein BKA69DRAFT_1127895 [Paraphysoderma sedebokerense]|nr:hypothetical protein BKA69DRAFT_1127895 [Paraphysoderma sedebokerense]